MLDVSGCPELSVSLSACKGAECSDRSRGPGLGDRPPLKIPSVGPPPPPPPLNMSVIINRERVAAVCGMARASSCTVMPATVDTFSPIPNTLSVDRFWFTLRVVQTDDDDDRWCSFYHLVTATHVFIYLFRTVHWRRRLIIHQLVTRKRHNTNTILNAKWINKSSLEEMSVLKVKVVFHPAFVQAPGVRASHGNHALAD